MMRKYYTTLGLVLLCLGSLQATDLVVRFNDTMKSQPVCQGYKAFFLRLCKEEQRQVLDTYEAKRKARWKVGLLTMVGGQAFYLRGLILGCTFTLAFIVLAILGLWNSYDWLKIFFGIVLLGVFVTCWLIEWYLLVLCSKTKDENARVFQQVLEETKTYKKALDEALAKASSKAPMYAQVPQGCLAYLFALSDQGQQGVLEVFNSKRKSLLTARWLAIFGGHAMYIKHTISGGLFTFVMLIAGLVYSSFLLYLGIGHKAFWDVALAILLVCILSCMIEQATLRASVKEVNEGLFLRQIGRTQATKVYETKDFI